MKKEKGVTSERNEEIDKLISFLSEHRLIQRGEKFKRFSCYTVQYTVGSDERDDRF